MKFRYRRDIAIQETTGQLCGEDICQEELNTEMEPFSQDIHGIQRILVCGSTLGKSLYRYPYTLSFQFHLLQLCCVVIFPPSRVTAGRLIMGQRNKML